MKRLVSRFTHLMGSHCASTQIADILRRQGLDITEELCFGIGAGLGFVYRKAFQPALYFLLGRSDDLEEKVFSHLGAHAIPYTTHDPERGWEEVKLLIDQDEPVIVNIDASHLGYLKARFDLFEHVRYGGHRVTVIGYDDEARTVFLSDYLWKEAQEVPLDDLLLARGSNAGQMPPENLFYSLLFPREFRPLSEAIRQGIRRNVDVMTHPWFDLIGLKGLEKFTARALDWPRLLSPSDLSNNARIVFMMLEVVGTGGGNFRRLYARFLREAMEILKEPRLNEAFSIYAGLGNLWKEVSWLMKESAENPDKGFFTACGTRSLLDEILSSEQKGMRILKEIVG